MTIQTHISLSIRSLIAFLLGMLLFGSVMAQKTWEEDVLYLKNGSILRGEIVEHLLRESVTIKLVDGTQFTFNTIAIEKITREPSRFMQIKLKYTRQFKPIVYRKPGFYHLFTMGFAFNENRWGEPELHPSLQYRLAYHVNQYLNLGVGTSIDTYEGGLVMPAMLDLHGDVFKRAFTPHYVLNLGYGFGLTGTPDHFQFKGGPMGHIGVGVKFRSTKRKEWILTVGYRGQHTYQEFREWPGGWWNPWGGRAEPVIVEGTRLYQKIVWQLTIGL